MERATRIIMNVQHNSTRTYDHPDVRNRSEISLHGRWLLLARVAWVVITILAIGLFVVALPSYYTYLHGISTT
jgi:hypothetical protein